MQTHPLIIGILEQLITVTGQGLVGMRDRVMLMLGYEIMRRRLRKHQDGGEAGYRAWLTEDPVNRSLVIVRPTVIFGEQNRGDVYNLLRQIATGRFIIFGSGANRKSMASVQSIAEFLALSIQL